MTNEEAKNNIDKNLDCGDVNNLDSEALCMAVEALEKQIPKKPIKKGEERLLLLCPKCESYNGYIENKFVFGKENKYCWHCGQALDWSDD